MSRARSIVLQDQRRLAFDDVGDPDGFPVFFFHGVPGSRLYWSLAGPGDPALDAGVRMLSVDRPGIGLSAPKSDRTVSSFSEDVLALADSLGLEQFGLLGFSGGASYAIHTAVAAPDRVAAVALVAPVGDLGQRRLLASMDPRTRTVLRLASRSSDVVERPIVKRHGARDLMVQGAERLWSFLPAADRRALSQERVRSSAVQTLEEAVRPGLEGARLDAELLLAPWECDLAEVSAPVDVFCGGADPWSTDEMCHWFKTGLRSCRLHRDPSGGHFTSLVTGSDDVLSALLEAASTAAPEFVQVV